MTKDMSYRLGRYEIIEKENGEIWWESHAGFGRLRAGKCFIIEDILFIGPYKKEKPGFLKGEFIEHLNKFPKWEKTKYHCSSYTIYNCKTGRRSRNFGADEDFRNEAPPSKLKGIPAKANKIKRINNSDSKEKFCEETIPKPVNLAKVIAKVKGKGGAIWRRIKDRFP
ncbi:hypothetical protein ACFL03_06865 [Thermodesulfobacteriota bacterium]